MANVGRRYFFILPLFVGLSVLKGLACDKNAIANSQPLPEGAPQFEMGEMGKPDLLTIPTEFDSSDEFEPWIFRGRADPLLAGGRQHFIDFLRTPGNTAVSIKIDRVFVGVVLLVIHKADRQIEIVGFAHQARISFSRLAPVLAECFFKDTALQKYLTVSPLEVRVTVPDEEIDAWRAFIEVGYRVRLIRDFYELTWNRISQ